MGAGILPQSNACHEARTIYWRLLLMNSVGLALVRSALFCRLARAFRHWRWVRIWRNTSYIQIAR